LFEAFVGGIQMRWIGLVGGVAVAAGVAVYDDGKLAEDPRGPQDEVDVLVWVLEGRSIELTDEVSFALVEPTAFRAQARFPNATRPGEANLTYGDFRQTGEHQVSYMCPTLGTVTFQISEDSIRWQMNRLGRSVIEGMSGEEIGAGGSVACGSRCARALAELERRAP
jgi:hypothetical protein